MKTFFLTHILSGLFLVFSSPVLAAPIVEANPGASALTETYLARPDLQQFFPGEDRLGNAVMRKAGMLTLEDWARKYGYKEFPELLTPYAPFPPALNVIPGAVTPKLKPAATFDFSSISASSVFVVDMASRKVLMSNAASAPHPLASISKLFTAMVVLDRKPVLSRRYSIKKEDEVGGARLSVSKGDTLSLSELLNVTLIASANNTANALARSTGLSKPAFIEAMNVKAKSIGLTNTILVDPTGIEVGNMSTAREIAALAIEAFNRDQIRRATTTSKYGLSLARGKHSLKNTNDVLNNDANGIVVLGGKTGYLEESKWNLVVKMRDSSNHPITVVVLGSESRVKSSQDAEKIGKWVWANYDWN